MKKIEYLKEIDESAKIYYAIIDSCNIYSATLYKARTWYEMAHPYCTINFKINKKGRGSYYAITYDMETGKQLIIKPICVLYELEDLKEFDKLKLIHKFVK